MLLLAPLLLVASHGPIPLLHLRGGRSAHSLDLISATTNDYELVCRATKEIEWILESEFGAPSGKHVGLHAKISAARTRGGQPLSPVLVSKLRRLATVRNSLVHDRKVNLISDRAAFVRDYEAVEASLLKLRGGRRGVRAGDAIGSVIGYNAIQYRPWQVRLLSATSVCMGGSAAFALASGQVVLGAFLSLSSLASLNYWRKPGPGWRRDADFATAGCTFVYCTLAGQQLSGAPNALAVAAFVGFACCFRRSFLMAAATPEGGDGSWARWHALGHLCVTIAAFALTAGDADMWLANPALVRPMRNPLWMSGLASTVAMAALDGWRAVRTRSELHARASIEVDVLR